MLAHRLTNWGAIILVVFLIVLWSPGAAGAQSPSPDNGGIGISSISIAPTQAPSLTPTPDQPARPPTGEAEGPESPPDPDPARFVPFGKGSFAIAVVIGVVLIGLVAVILLGIVMIGRRHAVRSSAPDVAAPTPQAGTPIPCLECRDHTHGPRIFSLSKMAGENGGFLVGRGTSLDGVHLSIDESFPEWRTVSRRHARFSQDSETGQVLIEDLESENGTFVQDRRTARNYLKDGWTVVIGGVSFIYRSQTPDGFSTVVEQGDLNSGETRSSVSRQAQTDSDSDTVTTSFPVAIDQDPDDTVKLRAAAGEFTPLPEGALFPQRQSNPQYHIVDVISESSTMNTYRAEARESTQLCPNPDCPSPQNQLADVHCDTCGAMLTEPPVRQRVVIKESSDPTAYASLAQLADLGTEHPGLLIAELYQEAPFGQSLRYYALSLDPGPILAADLPVPQKVPRVLGWGHWLADGLAFLHANHLVWPKIDSQHIAVDGKRAQWTNFITRFVPQEHQSQAADLCARDVRALAMVLFQLATGTPEYTADTQLPVQAQTLFDQVLGIEASVISAEELALSIRNALDEIQHPGSMRLVSAARTDVGTVRELNEDSLLAQETTLIHRGLNQPIGLYAVADGMGGHSAGDVASGIVVNTLAHMMATDILASRTATGADLPSFEPSTWLANSFSTANRAVFDQRQRAGTDMGTTLVAALLVGDTAFLGNIGDSRVYRLNNEEICQLTTDHSLVERLVATGQISREEARFHPQRNVIYRTVGDKEDAGADFSTYQLKIGDSLLICSDGLNGMLSDQEIWQITVESPSPDEACTRLIAAANAAGGDDNITVILVQLVPG